MKKLIRRLVNKALNNPENRKLDITVSALLIIIFLALTLGASVILNMILRIYFISTGE